MPPKKTDHQKKMAETIMPLHSVSAAKFNQLGC